MAERLNKLLSRYGLCSRREADRWLEEGRVTVNGTVAQLGQRADDTADVIAVDGVPLTESPPTVCLLLNKPRGYVTTLSDEQGRPTVADLIADCGLRLAPVGRLDLNSEGLLLMSNDGALIQYLTHPSHQVEKEYYVRVTGPIQEAMPRLRRPMTVGGELYSGAKVRLLREGEGSALLSFTIVQGKNRQVRKMCQAVGLTVHRLRRVREGNLHLGSLPAGSWRWLTEEELEHLRDVKGK